MSFWGTANFVAYQKFDITDIDLNYYDRNLIGSNFYDNADFTFAGTTHQDYYIIDAGDESEKFRIFFFGYDFVFNADGSIGAGIVNAVAEANVTSGTSVLWLVDGIGIGASQIYSAALTPSNADDYQLFVEALNGNDLITLSPFDDRMNGFDGNDMMKGGAGNDILDGGSGADTAVYSGAFADATIAFQGAEIIVTMPGEGTDRLTNFEFISFADGTRSVASLMDIEPPAVVTLSPSDGAGTASPTANIVVTFNEQIGRGAGTIALRADAPDGTLIEQFDAATSARLSYQGATLSIDPTADLAAGTRYFVVLEPGVVEDLAGNGFAGLSSYSFTTAAPAIPVPASNDWRMLTSDGFAGTTGGSGAVLGTAGFQDITVLGEAGAVVFDPSFNRGGDIVRLDGAAADWQIARTGSSALFTDGDSFVQLPIGTAGTAIVFDDGARTLKVADGSPMIGSQALGVTLADIAAAPDGAVLPTGAIPDSPAKLFLSAGAGASAGGVISIFGTAAAETVSLLSGDFRLDPSFNRGGDTLRLMLDAADFTAMRVGSSVILESGTSEIAVPVGLDGLTLSFADGDRTLLFDSGLGAIRIGDQQIGFSPVPLTDFA